MFYYVPIMPPKMLTFAYSQGSLLHVCARALPADLRWPRESRLVASLLPPSYWVTRRRMFRVSGAVGFPPLPPGTKGGAPGGGRASLTCTRLQGGLVTTPRRCRSATARGRFSCFRASVTFVCRQQLTDFLGREGRKEGGGLAGRGGPRSPVC